MAGVFLDGPAVPRRRRSITRGDLVDVSTGKPDSAG
jgi:ribosome-associated protein YbcJ (S4-like RNA binding protein)